MNFKSIRITLLILVLAYIAFDTFWSNQRATDWKRSLRVVIYPINADDSVASTNYIKKLELEQFDQINKLLENEALKYNRELNEAIRFDLAPELESKPPALPNTRSALSIMWWSIQLRYWAWKEDNYKGPTPQIKAYALFYDPKTHNALKHSTGLKKAKIAINNLFASDKQTKQNNIILLHELLHTLGATDKYNLQTGYPIFPDGFANSNKQPSLPQTHAEIMGGRIPLNTSDARIPVSLENVVIGHKTAKEIGWID